MFRGTRTPPDPWDDPHPPARAAALAIVGVAGTISLVVGALMWAGTTASQPRTLDSPALADAPAARVGVVETSEPPATSSPLSPVPLPPALPAAPPTTAPPTASMPATMVADVLETAMPAPATTPETSLAEMLQTTTIAPTTTLAPTTPPLPTAPTTVAVSATSTTTTLVPTSTTSTTTSTTTTAAPTTAPVRPTLWALLRDEPSLSRFAILVEEGGVAASLDVDAAHTLLAPDDAAIAAYAMTPEGEAELSNPSSIRAFVLRHLVLVDLDAAALFAAERVETASGAWLDVDAAAGTVGAAAVTRADLMASNGVLHVVDTPVTASR